MAPQEPQPSPQDGTPGQSQTAPMGTAADWEPHMGIPGTPAGTTGLLKHPKNPRWHPRNPEWHLGNSSWGPGTPATPQEPQKAFQEPLQNLGKTGWHPWEPCSTPGTPAAPHAHRDLAPLGTLCQHPATSRAQCQHPLRTLDPSDLFQHPVCVGTLCCHPAPMETQCQHSGGHWTLWDPVPASSGTQHLQGPHSSTLRPRGPCASVFRDTAPTGTPCQHPWGHNAYRD